ncbi:MAG: hypothetical protein WAM88_01610 [Nitrososphaeraceae archaeon]
MKRLDKIALEGAMSDPVPTFETSGLMVYLQLLLIVHSRLEFDYLVRRRGNQSYLGRGK